MFLENFQTIDYIYLLIGVLFFIISIFVIFRDKSVINWTFASSGWMFSIWAFLSPFLKNSVNIFFSLFLLFLFIFAPLGMVLSGWMILNGTRLKIQSGLMIYLFLYVGLGVLLGILNFQNRVSSTNQNLLTAIINLYMLTALIAVDYYFYQVYKITSNKKVLFVLAGMTIGIIGQIINAINYFFYGDYPIIAFVAIICGLVITLISFTTIHKNNPTGT